MSNVSVEFGAIWEKSSDKGEFLSIRSRGKSYIALKNEKKSDEKHPDWRIFEGFDSDKDAGAIWMKKTKKGLDMMSGHMNGEKFVGFKNAYATPENRQPQWKLLEPNNA